MLIKDDRHQNLGTRDRSLVKLINENPDLFMDITITEFAKRAQTSASVISKFIRRLHFESYREFQNHLTREKVAHETISRISLDNNALIINHSNYDLKNYDHYFLSKTINNLDYRNFIKLVDQISQARRIWIIGHDNSQLAALDLTNSLIHLGKAAFSTADTHQIDLQLDYLTAQDLVIFISESWKTSSYYDLARNLKANRIATATITGLNNFFVPVTDFIVTFYSPLNLKEQPPFYNAKIQELFINNLLIQAVAKRINQNQ